MQRSRRAPWRSLCSPQPPRRNSRQPPLPKPDTPPPVPPILQNYKPVTADRLKQPEDGDWLMYRRTYDGWGYSPLSQITTENAAKLKPVWTLATGQIEGHQAPPIVNNGVMFVATPGNQLLAIDAKAGNLLWRFKRPIPEDMLLLHPTSRGVGLLGDKVYFAAADAVLVALDAKTGNEVWKAAGRGLHPRILHVAGAAGRRRQGHGRRLGRRARCPRLCRGVRRRDRQTAWKTYTVPEPGEPGSETWPKGDQWKTGGGSVWITGTYDPETNLSLLGHRQWRAVDGRPAPRRQSLHLFGARARYRDRQDQGLSPVSPERFLGLGRGLAADPRRLPAQWQDHQRSRRRRARRLSVDARAHRRQDQLRRRQAVREAERLHESRSRRPGGRTSTRSGSRRTGKKADFCPSLWGGKDWPPVAYSPKTRLLYIPANENLCGTIDRRTCHLHAGTALCRGDDDPLYRAGRRPYRRAAGLEPRHRPKGVEPSLCQFAALGTGAGDRRRRRVRRRNQRPVISAPSTPPTARPCGNSAPARG